MAEILTTLGWLAFGIAIGWGIKRTFFAPVFEESDMAQLSREWGQHLADHAEMQKASVVWTAPEAKLLSEQTNSSLPPNWRSWPTEAIGHE